MLQDPSQRSYALLSGFVFFFFFAQAAAISLLSIWLSQSLHLSGAAAGMVFSANFIAAMASQPLYGYISDRMGFRRLVPAATACLVTLAGPFFLWVYAPLLRFNLLAGAVVGGLYIGVTFVAGSYALEAYINRISRRDGFEYSRVRLWGSLGFAAAAFVSGDLYNLNPNLNFFLASAAGLVLLPLIWGVRGSRDAMATGPASDAPGDALRLADAAGVLVDPKFWRLMVLILGVTNLYLVYDLQFPHYFASMFATPARGNAMFGYLNSAQIFVEAGMMFVAPVIVRRTGAKNGLLIATAIMIVRIAGSGLAIGPLTISACKMLHSLELPILMVSIFRYIGFHFEQRLSATIYMVGISFGHSLGLALLSPVVGSLYDVIGFPHTYFIIAAFAAVFWTTSTFALSPTPNEMPRGAVNEADRAKANAAATPAKPAPAAPAPIH